MTTELETNDPFSPLADPNPPLTTKPATTKSETTSDQVAAKGRELAQHACRCGGERGIFSRRQALVGLGLVASAPVFASVNPNLVPCYPEQQKPEPCHHKFCKYYAGHDDYYGR